jgi:hypothetical protein
MSKNNPVLATARLLAVLPPTNIRLLETCFAFRNPSYLLTAAHCIANVPQANLVTAGEAGRVGHVERIVFHPTADIAILKVKYRTDDPFWDENFFRGAETTPARKNRVECRPWRHRSNRCSRSNSLASLNLRAAGLPTSPNDAQAPNPARRWTSPTCASNQSRHPHDPPMTLGNMREKSRSRTTDRAIPPDDVMARTAV